MFSLHCDVILYRVAAKWMHSSDDCDDNFKADGTANKDKAVILYSCTTLGLGMKRRKLITVNIYSM